MPRFFRYGVVGAFATAVHYLVLVLCVEAIGWPAWLASGLGAVIGAQVAYLGNRRYTFAHRGAIGESWLKFQSTALFAALLGMAVVAVGVRIGLHYVLAQIVATGLNLLVTSAINRSWAFRTQR
ncbi:MAG: GtrA family protein [Caldimonas sp.]